MWLRRQKPGSVCRRDVQECFVAEGTALFGFAVSVQKAGTEVGEGGIEGMAEAPSLAPACVLCLSHPCCAVRVMPAQRNTFGHHSNFWF